jgi:integrase
VTTSHSNCKSRGTKPQKPCEDYPLYAHRSGKWAVKILGRTHYFGRWDDPAGALVEYEAVKDDLRAGRDPVRNDPTAVTVRDAVNAFLTAKKQRVDSGELSQRTFDEYLKTAERVIKHFGRAVPVLKLTPTDFNSYRAKIAKTCGPVRVGTEVQRVRTLFKHAFDSELIDRPARFGADFKKPSKLVMRRHRQATGKRLFNPEQINLLLDEVGIHMRAMVFLGINAGFGNGDCGNMPLDVVDFATDWLDFPRPKTAIPRRVPLWPETLDALRRSLTRRPQPAGNDAERLFFVTHEGLPWAKSNQTTNPVSQRTTSALKRLGFHRAGMSFYWLRHTFNTVAEQTGDQIAVRAIMGHVDDSMSANYRHEISDDRLRAVTDHVRRWLFESENQ